MFNAPVEILWASRYEYEPDSCIKQHVHASYYQISFILKGESRFDVGGVVRTMKKGQMLLCHPGKQHSIYNFSDWNLNTIELKFLVHDDDLNAKIMNIDSFVDLPNIQHYIKLLYNEGLHHENLYQDYCNVYLFMILLSIIRNDETAYLPEDDPEGDTTRKSIIINNFEEYIKAHFQDDLTLSIIAGALGYNANYLCQCVKAHFDMSPMRYLYSYRMQRARDLILYSELSLNQVALETGFKTIHHFSNMFKKQFGMSPGSYRRINLEAVNKDIFFNAIFTYNNYVQRGTAAKDNADNSR